jgi:ABC-type antimicrobial peptide transport system permease subunit
VALRLRRPRFVVALVGAFAALSLLLGMAGTYGVVAYAVSLRRRELGVRSALGAAPGRLLREALGEGLRLVAIGGAGGLLAALAANRLLAGMLHGVGVADPLVLTGTALLLIASGLLACLPPALRASHVDPGAELRSA